MTKIPKGTFPRHQKNTKTMSHKQAEEIRRNGCVKQQPQAETHLRLLEAL